ncbi:sulfatase-like hydrolase/transferase [Halopelagius inordinatus]|uniref:sulfatase-like hydrolase/transferase n=1 Tax=Halopelagius inordinatus TaxID=553467 RepID=UPI002481EEEE|nr:sulfatase-like hydrolase/transferase [Halopelagius inordinatus]
MGRVKKGIQHILHGNLSEPIDFIIRERGISRIDKFVDSFESRESIVSPEKESIVQNNEWYFPVTRTDETEFISEEPVSRIDFHVVKAGATGTFEVCGEFTTTVGDTVQRTVTKDSNHPQEREHCSIQFTFDEPVIEGTLTLEAANSSTNSVGTALLNAVTEQDRYEGQRPRLQIPRLRRETDNPPIILLSIDALRWDVTELLTWLFGSYADDFEQPEEPRTQGRWTAPSHGSMFTGVHPGDHRYVGARKPGDPSRPIHPELESIPKLLSRRGYKSSAIVSHTRILPEFGFGRGFDRFKLHKMAHDRWNTRETDARATVDQLIEWLDVDVGTSNVFYFAHLFDAHYPYYPPRSLHDGDSVDYDVIQQFTDLRPDNSDYLKLIESTDDPMDPQVLDEIKRYYGQSVDYIGSQLVRLFDRLETHDLYDDALIFITGDHGEEFGERGVYSHTSLYDENIRPAVLVKPPENTDWSVPTETDELDILPTIARAVGESPPSYCPGVPWQEDVPRRTRITERIDPDWYNVSIEEEGIKGIFTYPENFPDRPTERTVDRGPEYEEFYRLEAVREGNTDDHADSIDEDTKRRLREKAASFVTKKPIVDDSGLVAETDQETKEHLRQLGYF